MRKSLILGLTSCFVFSGCALRNSSPSPQGLEHSEASLTETTADVLADTFSNPYWKKRSWLEKTVRLLRGGQGLTTSDDIDGLMKMSEEEIVRALMKDERFGDTILDFNAYFLGFKPNQIRVGDRLNPSLLGLSTAVASAQEIAREGDYFKIFDFTGPVFSGPLFPVSFMSEKEREESKDIPEHDLRLKNERLLQGLLQSILEFAQTPGVTTESACKRLAGNDSAFNRLLLNGYPFHVALLGIFFNNEWAGKIRTACSRSPIPANPSELIATLQTVIRKNEIFFSEMAKFDSFNGYKVVKLSEAKAIDMRRLGLPETWPSANFEQSRVLANSSTNMNRKRSAYVLKHFFCDDLTPLGFETPDQHTGGAHGSDTGCYACHYKLDPMAGFFRSYGNFFNDYSKSPIIVFDDGAVQTREQYEKNWLAPEASGRKWNIGYVRSAGTPAINSYGESLEDLTRIVRASPEAKKCVVRRMFEYFVAKNQAVDAGYLQDLADKFIAESATSSTSAVRNTIARLMLSNAYHERDMDPKKCYDFKPGTEPGKNSVPCQVSFILNNYCVTCHNDVADADHGNLDLSQWIDTGGGVPGFPHLNKEGKQRSARETLQMISESLASTDPRKRMPYRRQFPAQERQELYNWLQEAAQSAGGPR